MKTNSTTTPQENTKKVFERTIDENLFEAWKSKRRTTDVRDLMKKTGKSEPIIYRALQFGHVKKQDLVDDISNFYIERSKKEKAQAEQING